MWVRINGRVALRCGRRLCFAEEPRHGIWDEQMRVPKWGADYGLWIDERANLLRWASQNDTVWKLVI
jgi:hypothetical protein